MSEVRQELTTDSFQKARTLVFSQRFLLIVSCLYVLSLAIAESVNSYLTREGSIIIYWAVLFGLIALASRSKERGQRRLWLALTLAPTVRIISLAMPVMLEISQFIWYVVVSIPILVAIVVLVRTLKYNVSDIGLKSAPPFPQILVAFCGITLAAAACIWLKPDAWTGSLTIQSTLFPALILLIFTGFVEELVFRGVMQRSTFVLGSYGWVLIAVIYAVLQIQRGSFEYCLVSLVAGLLFGWVVKHTGSITGVSLAHGFFNIGLFLVFPHVIHFSV